MYRFENQENKRQPDGYAGLDFAGKVDRSQLQWTDDNGNIFSLDYEVTDGNGSFAIKCESPSGKISTHTVLPDGAYLLTGTNPNTDETTGIEGSSTGISLGYSRQDATPVSHSIDIAESGILLDGVPPFNGVAASVTVPFYSGTVTDDSLAIFTNAPSGTAAFINQGRDAILSKDDEGFIELYEITDGQFVPRILRDSLILIRWKASLQTSDIPTNTGLCALEIITSPYVLNVDNILDVLVADPTVLIDNNVFLYDKTVQIVVPAQTIILWLINGLSCHTDEATPVPGHFSLASSLFPGLNFKMEISILRTFD